MLTHRDKVPHLVKRMADIGVMEGAFLSAMLHWSLRTHSDIQVTETKSKNLIDRLWAKLGPKHEA